MHILYILLHTYCIPNLHLQQLDCRRRPQVRREEPLGDIQHRLVRVGLGSIIDTVRSGRYRTYSPFLFLYPILDTISDIFMRWKCIWSIETFRRCIPFVYRYPILDTFEKYLPQPCVRGAQNLWLRMLLGPPKSCPFRTSEPVIFQRYCANLSCALRSNFFGVKKRMQLISHILRSYRASSSIVVCTYTKSLSPSIHCNFIFTCV